MIVLIDNYDSFSYNLYQLIGGTDPQVRVIRNDGMTVAEIMALAPSHIVISPGPGRPADAGVSIPLVLAAAGKIPLLGVCLGHQAICAAFGGRITYARKLMHGKRSQVTVRPDGLFAGLPGKFAVARYHSLALDADTLPPVLAVTATAEDGEIMAVRHREFPIYGVQFHPESILTEFGEEMIRNFLKAK